MFNLVSHTLTATLAQNTLQAIAFPTNVMVQGLKVVRLAGGDFNLKFYNRNLEASPIDIMLIDKSDLLTWPIPSPYVNGAVKVSTREAHGLRDGDLVTIAGCAVSAYNGTDIRVHLVLDPYTVLVDLEFVSLVSNEDAGTLTGGVPAAEWPVHLFATVTQAGWVNPAGVPMAYNSQGPDDNTGRPRLVWVYADTAGTYVIAADVTSDD